MYQHKVRVVRKRTIYSAAGTSIGIKHNRRCYKKLALGGKSDG